MKKAFATLLTATFLLTSCTAVNESTVSSVSELSRFFHKPVKYNIQRDGRIGSCI